MHLVCPTKASTSVSWCEEPRASVSAHMPLMPGRSMDACSWMPIPLRIIRSEPILNAPDLLYKIFIKCLSELFSGIFYILKTLLIRIKSTPIEYTTHISTMS